MSEDGFAYVLDGTGGATKIALGARAGSLEGAPFEWRHFPRDAPETAKQLTGCGLDPFVIEALCAKETRPRCTVHDIGDTRGVLLNLRGVNLNPGAEPEDMISVRLWVEKDRVIGVYIRRLFAVSDMADAIDHGQAPVSVGDFVARLALRLTDRAEPFIATLSEAIDGFEDAMLEDGEGVSRRELSDLRRSAIVMRRYFIPQRDALARFEMEDLGWLSDHDRMRLREAVERVVRLGEDLDAIRDRAQIVHDQIMDERAERMNSQSLLLSVVAAIFLPLGLLTGLLGINVGGMPGVDAPWAFWVVSVLLVALGAGLYAWMRALGFFR